MRYRSLGTSGLTVSVVGLSCHNLGSRVDPERSRAVIGAALDVGITLIDTADVYSGDTGRPGGCEALLGRLLKGRRDQVVLATKSGHPRVDLGYGPAAGGRGGRDYIRRAIEGSLRRLQTDYIDLFQIHALDPVTPIDETLSALDELVTAGKVRYIGSTDFAAWRITDAEHVARHLGTTRFVSTQTRWSILDRRAEAHVVPAAGHHGVGVLAYYPLASGLLTGKLRKALPRPPVGSRLEILKKHWAGDARLDTVEALIDFSARNGVAILDVAIGSLIAHPGCGSAIAGATNPDQVRANAAAADFTPTTEQLAEIDALTSTVGANV